MPYTCVDSGVGEVDFLNCSQSFADRHLACVVARLSNSVSVQFESLWGRTFLVGIIRVFLGRGASSPRSLPAAAAAARASRMAWCTVIALRGGV